VAQAFDLAGTLEPNFRLGGIQILEARDLNHAVQLVSQQPGFKYGLGPIEIRPVADLSEIIKESEQLSIVIHFPTANSGCRVYVLPGDLRGCSVVCVHRVG
jgi:hypothetical protein